MADLITDFRGQWLGVGFKAATPQHSAEHGLETAAHASIAGIDARAWDALAPGSAEGYDLYRTLETITPPGFKLGALTVRDGRQLIAAAPMFRCDFRLDTPFQGRIRALTDRVHHLAPRLTTLRIIGLGSPMSDNCNINLHPNLTPEQSTAARVALVDRLMALAKAEASQVIVVKSLGSETPDWHATLDQRQFSRIRSVPVVALPLPYTCLDHYLASLPDKMGAYFKRKMKPASALRIEYRTSIEGLEGQIQRLYESTLQQSAVSYGEFDALHPDYVSNLLRNLGPRAQLMLCWRGDELLSFQIFIVGAKRIIANKIGMQYPEAREFNLYFVNWLKMIEFACERGIAEIEMGATTYAAKMLFGGQLEPRNIYFRFQNGVANTLTRPLHGLFDFEKNDPELQRLAAQKLEAANALTATLPLKTAPSQHRDTTSQALKPQSPKNTTGKKQKARAGERPSAQMPPGLAKHSQSTPGQIAPDKSVSVAIGSDHTGQQAP